VPRSNTTYGLDSSVFLRLLTGLPEGDYQQALTALAQLFEDEPAAELVVSNQVIGESYVALQHFYGLSKADACAGILKLLTASDVRPLNGEAVLACLRAKGGPGLVDRLIAQDYAGHDARVLTNDKRMARLEGVQQL